MPRKPLIRCSRFPYHVVTRAHNREWFPLNLQKVWEICLDSLELANSKHPIELINFVLMNNHYHMMLKTPGENLDQFMYELNKNISLRLRKETKQINQVFGGRYKWCLIQSSKYLINCYRYVYQNPLRAGVVNKCENYPYSTLPYLKDNNKKFPLQIYDHFGFKDEFGLHWINEEVKESETEAVRNGLRKRELVVLKDKKTRKEL